MSPEFGGSRAHECRSVAALPQPRSFAIRASTIAILLAVFAACSAPQPGPDNLLAGRAPQMMTFAHNGWRISDGRLPAAGAIWDSTVTSIIDSGGSVQWDLGRVEKLTRAFIQGDNNDTYALRVSDDGQTWRTLWEAGPVTAIGMQERQAQGLDGSGRYLRLEPRGGDGYYSVSELAVSSLNEGPWPPALARVDGSSREFMDKPDLVVPVTIAGVLALLVLVIAWHVRTRPRLWANPLPWSTLAISIFVVTTAWLYARQYRGNVVDDAYISFQYAKNWASGAGLVFNPGERVEGYTNFLWVALLTPLWSLSGHDPAAMAHAAVGLSIALGVLTLVLVAVVGRRVFQSPTACLLAVLLVAFDDSFIGYAAVFALENHLLMALVTAGLALLIWRPRGWAWALGLSFALVGMTRPDGLLWAFTFLAVFALNRRGDDHIPLRVLVRIALAFAVPFAIYFAARFAYFGEVLPNTFYLKVGSTLSGLRRGWGYVYSYGEQRLAVPVLALVAAYFVRSAWVRWLVLYCVGHAAYVMYVGGDFYAGHRFLLVLAPLIALLVGALFERASALPELKWRRVGLAAALLACVAVRWGTLRGGHYGPELHHWETVVDNNVKYMEWLRDVARPNPSMVVGDIGATGFFANTRVLDVFGVVDRGVAHKQVADFGTGKAGHEKRLSREEMLAGEPSYIKWGYMDDALAPPGYYIFNEFPPFLKVDGLWVRDDLEKVQALDGGWHFEGDDWGDWTATGDAFGSGPAHGTREHQMTVLGAQGGLVNTFHAQTGDDATGQLSSPEFVLNGDRLRLRVGGGRDPERLRVSLFVGDRPIYSTTGNDSEVLGRREWDIRAYRGQNARLEIIDNAKGAWGHILVDEIEQVIAPAQRPAKL